MLRIWFILLLLTNYLLVVGAGFVDRPEPPRYSAAHPYVHSKECQQRNYLRLDCFDTCNGDQTALQAKPTHETPRHLLSSFKSLDLHCLPEQAGAPVSFTLPRPVPVPARTLAVAAGQADEVYAPPRRG